MNGQWMLILKLLVISTVLSAAIKYLVPLANIPATVEVALFFVITPTLVMMLILLWRGWQFQKQQNQKLESKTLK